MAKKKPPCPKCSSKKVIPIEYGYPMPEAEAAAMAGKIILGGCIILPDQPEWCCASCGHEWREERPTIPQHVGEPPVRATKKTPARAKGKSVMARFKKARAIRSAATNANEGAKRPISISAAGHLPTRNPEDRVYLDEDWLKKVHARKSATPPKARRPRKS